MVASGLPPIAAAPERRWILALSGGGYRGLFTAAVLTHLEAELGRPLHTAFDLIAGTSIGSILALALARGTPAAELVEFFRREGEAIFPRPTLWRKARTVFRPKYASDALRDAVETALVRATFNNLDTHVVVPAVGLSDAGPALFRTANGSSPASDISLSDAALASSAAPTYFRPHTVGQQHFVDGGLIANSPDSLAINEATAVLGWPVGTLHLLSVGTTYVEVGVAFKPKLAHWGIARWGYRLTLLEQMMSAQAKLSRDMAQRTLPGRFYQIDAIRSADQDQAIALDRASPVATNTLLAMAQNSWHTLRGSAGGRTMLQSLSLHQRI